MKLDEDEFVKRFKPETDAQGSLYVQRDWTNPEDKALIDKAQQENRLWTALDGETDEGDTVWCLVPGWHYVNRLYYVICEVPYTEADLELEVVDDTPIEA